VQSPSSARSGSFCRSDDALSVSGRDRSDLNQKSELLTFSPNRGPVVSIVTLCVAEVESRRIRKNSDGLQDDVPNSYESGYEEHSIGLARWTLRQRNRPAPARRESSVHV
jgi:hypothetical protein